jgi:hypothetical protein
VQNERKEHLDMQRQNAQRQLAVMEATKTCPYWAVFAGAVLTAILVVVVLGAVLSIQASSL